MAKQLWAVSREARRKLATSGSPNRPNCCVMFLLANFLQLLGTIKRTIFRKVRTKTILKIYNTLVLPTFLYGLEIWTLTALQRRRTEAAEMKLLRPLAGYTLYDHKTND